MIDTRLPNGRPTGIYPSLLNRVKAVKRWDERTWDEITKDEMR